MEAPDREGLPQFCVIHVGARLHYEVPAVLARAGMLRAVYTDFALWEDRHQLPAALTRFLPKPLRRMLGRRLPADIPRGAVRRFPQVALRDQFYERFVLRDQKSAEECARLQLGGHRLGAHAVRSGFDRADALYTHPCVATAAMAEARARGLFVVLEATAHPLDQFIEDAECRKYGAPRQIHQSTLRANYSLFIHECSLADVVLAASPYSARGLVEAGVPSEKVVLVPYGHGREMPSAAPQPERGRVLFVGTIGYRKGGPCLAEASRLLAVKMTVGEVRAVGPSSRHLVDRGEFRGPTYTGQVPRAEVQWEFERADLFAFPTLSDAFGIVLIEALRAGLPIVSTPNCADIVEDGVNGLLVPTGDAARLAQAIETIVLDRSLRARMSRAAQERARDFSAAAYERRLANVLSARFRDWRTNRGR